MGRWTKGLLALALATGAWVGGTSGPALAAPVAITACGQVVTTDAVLTVDLSCPTGDGVVVGASGITVDLDGHLVTGSPTGNGVNISSFDDVTVTGGLVSGFVTGVRVFQAQGVTVTGTQIAVAPGALTSGVVLGDAHDSTVVGSTITGGGIGVLVELGADNTVRANLLQESQQGVLVSTGSRTVISGNRVTGSGGGIVIGTTSTDTTVAANVLATGVSGIYVDPFGNTDTSIHDNVATDFASDGIFVDAGTSTVTLADNLVARNNTGITVRTAATTITSNVATDNQALGIDAIAGVTDGGGNVAYANGDPRQCVGVVCAGRPLPDPLTPPSPIAVITTPRFTG